MRKQKSRFKFKYIKKKEFPVIMFIYVILLITNSIMPILYGYVEFTLGNFLILFTSTILSPMVHIFAFLTALLIPFIMENL